MSGALASASDVYVLELRVVGGGRGSQHQAAANAKSANNGSAPEPKQVKHGSQVIAEGILGYVPMLLNSKVDGIVTRDKT